MGQSEQVLEPVGGASATDSGGGRLALILVAQDLMLRRAAACLDPRHVALAAVTTPPLNLEAAAELCRRLACAPDVVILAGGPELLARGAAVELVRTLLPSSPVLLITAGEDRELIRHALRAGVHGLVGEARLEQTLMAAVRALAAGQLCVPLAVSERIDTMAFSSREREVLDFVTGGLTNAQIARQLFLSESTVKSHLASSFRKLGLSSRAEAAAAWAGVVAVAGPAEKAHSAAVRSLSDLRAPRSVPLRQPFALAS